MSIETLRQMENSALGRLSVSFDSPFKARSLEARRLVDFH